MNAYYLFYCRAYDWYNTNNKKSKDTLRVSAIALLSAMPTFHILTIVCIIGLIDKKTPIDAWVMVVTVFILLAFNLLLISPNKSDDLRNEYLLLDDWKKTRINVFFYIYLIISVSVLIALIIYTAYCKHKYGNYDENFR